MLFTGASASHCEAGGGQPVIAAASQAYIAGSSKPLVARFTVVKQQRPLVVSFLDKYFFKLYGEISLIFYTF